MIKNRENKNMQSEELLALLVQLSKVDNYFDEFELTYLLKVGKYIGLNDHKVETLIKSDKAPASITIPPEEMDRMKIIYYMLFLMKVDDKVSEEEIELLHPYGFKLGFSAPMLNEFVGVVSRYQDTRIPPDALLKIIKKYQN